ncbi:DUF6624 domain-containing protein [Desertivirga brevis]|uniref:DUF6624 domain-containing protein n=1 Tax=Desertivirga brevis TaxID=2810310 RepID=UPI001A97C86D|nr:DUF6624 domain-containing protein [Pedobacter sp. SYSU D00873]
MKAIYILTFFLTLFNFQSFAQTENLYDKYLKQGEQYAKDREFVKAAESYTKAFLSNHDKGRIDHRYQAARYWAMASVPDSALYQLERIANSGSYWNYSQISTDTVFVQLHNNKRWDPLLEKVYLNQKKWDGTQKERREIADKKLNKPLVRLLDTVYFDDQNLRKQLDKVIKEHGERSVEVTSLMESIRQNDSVNLVKVRSILDRYGWPGKEEVGDEGSRALFLVIQHADLKTQTKYLPMLQKAVKEGKAAASQLAFLEDRIAIGNGKRQLYGSQLRLVDGVYYVLPVEDPDNLDKRRTAMGMQSMAEYLKHFNLKWDVERYKLELPEIEKKVNEVKKSRQRL